MNKNTVKYALTFVPLTLLSGVLSISAYKIHTIYLFLGIGLMAFLLLMIKKIVHFPQKIDAYSLEDIEYKDSEKFKELNIRVCKSKTLDAHDFLLRTKDIVFNIGNKDTFIVLSDKFYTSAKTYIRDMLIESEYDKLKNNYHLKSLMILLWPTQLFLNFYLICLHMGLDVKNYLMSGLMIWVFPFLIMIFIIMNIKIYNGYLAKVDTKLDHKLLLQYSYEQVLEYIDTTEQFIGGIEGEKKEIYEHAVKLRKNNLKWGR